jgi:IS6 family transposase
VRLLECGLDPRPAPVPRSAFAGFRFPPDVIVLAVRWYLRFGLSYRDLEDLLTERGVEVDHVTIYRWVQRFTPLLVDAARPCRHVVGDRWLEELVPAAWHRTDRYANNRVECDHGQLKARLRSMRDLKHDRSARVILAGRPFVQNIRRGHYELAVEEPATRRMAVALPR